MGPDTTLTVVPADSTVATKPGLLKGKTTWLCTFNVLVDLPSDMAQADMEGVIAQGLAIFLVNLGLPANVSATLIATQGNATVLNPTDSKRIVSVPTSTGPTI